MFCFIPLSQAHEDLLKFRGWRLLGAMLAQNDAQIAFCRRISAMKILGCELEHGMIILGMSKRYKLSDCLTRLRSAVGERKKWSVGGVTAGTEWSATPPLIAYRRMLRMTRLELASSKRTPVEL